MFVALVSEHLMELGVSITKRRHCMTWIGISTSLSFGAKSCTI